MQTITTETTVGEIVSAVPARSRIFEKLGIDYCCGGKKPIAEVCLAKGLDPLTVVAMLAALDDVADASVPDTGLMSLSDLCDHIEKVHHSYLKEELQRLDFMTRKVAAVHGDHEPRLLQIQSLFEQFGGKVAAHTLNEDQVIFPAIRQLESKATDQDAAPANLKTLLEGLEEDHERTGEALAQFRALSDDYTPPGWACNTFRALYDGLAHLEKDMHQHVHKENNVLFPRALAVAYAG